MYFNHLIDTARNTLKARLRRLRFRSSSLDLSVGALSEGGRVVTYDGVPHKDGVHYAPRLFRNTTRLLGLLRRKRCRCADVAQLDGRSMFLFMIPFLFAQCVL
jgi:hypothetical protein